MKKNKKKIVAVVIAAVIALGIGIVTFKIDPPVQGKIDPPVQGMSFRG